MKKNKLIYLLVAVFSLCFSLTMNAQDNENPTSPNQTGNSLRDRITKRQQQQQGIDQGTSTIKVPNLSVRAQKKNEENVQDLSYATWVREVYRFLDLKKGKNAALYYPVQPIGNRMNLFTLIFKLMGEGKLTGYTFNVEEQETFADEKKVKFADVLTRLEIPFQQNGNVFVYDEFSIPANEVLGYYIKEAWYFDQKNSMIGVKTIALCPIVFREEYIDGISMENPVSRQPQFWVKYEDIRSYASMMPIMTSDMNNVLDKTIDDYFLARLYEGEIYKTTNMENKLLVEKFKTEEEVKSAQARIEKELTGFQKNLWVTDSISSQKKDAKASKSKSKPAKGRKAAPRMSAKDRK